MFSFLKAEMQPGSQLGSGKGACQPPSALPLASREHRTSCFRAEAPLGRVQRRLAKVTVDSAAPALQKERCFYSGEI